MLLLHLGHTLTWEKGRQLKSFDGNTVARYLYDPWGVPTVTNANGTLITNPEHIGNLNPFRYRGYYYGKETGWYYLQSRYYAPEVERFLNADSVAVLSNSEDFLLCNLFCYCFNNPVNSTDFSGELSAQLVARIILGAIVGLIVQLLSDIIANWFNHLFGKIDFYDLAADILLTVASVVIGKHLSKKTQRQLSKVAKKLGNGNRNRKKLNLRVSKINLNASIAGVRLNFGINLSGTLISLIYSFLTNFIATKQKQFRRKATNARP